MSNVGSLVYITIDAQNDIPKGKLSFLQNYEMERITAIDGSKLQYVPLIADKLKWSKVSTFARPIVGQAMQCFSQRLRIRDSHLATGV